MSIKDAHFRIESASFISTPDVNLIDAMVTQTTVALSSGDYVEIFIGNETDAANATIEHGNLVVIAAG